MHIGVHGGVQLGVRELARRVEALGFESLWVSERTHLPAGYAREHPDYAAAANLPDPFVTLAAAAAVTERLRVGTAVCVVPARDPILLAKEVATLDGLSVGRFLFGVGAGWLEGELANHGTGFDDRFEVLRERLLAMQAIWTAAEAEFHGRFVDFDPIVQGLAPVQRPHPPLLIGGGGWARRLAKEHGGDWFPHATEVAGLSFTAEERVTAFDAPADADELRRLAEAGVHRANLTLRPATWERLDELAELAAPFARAGQKSN